MRKMLRQLRFDDCPSSKLHVCKKNARKACKAFADVFSFDISKTKTPKNSGLFVEIYSASSSLLRSKADCRS